MAYLVVRGLLGTPGLLLTRGLEFGAADTTPTSLLGALKAYWTASGLVDDTGPLYVQIAKKSADLPFVVLDGIREHLPGLTPEDIPIELYMTVWHTSASAARTAARLIRDHMGDPSEVPRAVDRDPLSWTVGDENFTESDGATPDAVPRPYKAGQAFRHRLHFRVWIRGRA